MEGKSFKKCVICGALVVVTVVAEPLASVLCPVKCEKHFEPHTHEEKENFSFYNVTGISGFSGTASIASLSGQNIKKYFNNI